MTAAASVSAEAHSEQLLGEQYSLPIMVRNTFIDTALEVSPSLAHFLRRREVRTCPSSKVGRFAGLFEEDEDDEGSMVGKATAATPETASLVDETPTASSDGTPPAVLLSLSDLCFGLPDVQQPVQHIVPLASAVLPPPPPGPAPGSEELPSLGSLGHKDGSCKPCAFLYTKGCSNGLKCEFCHLCDDGERKRRRKAKIEAKRAGRQAA